ncbi:MAG: NfeD family protein, partial [Roseiarcus sp.]
LGLAAGDLALCAPETGAPGAFLIWIGAAGRVTGAIDFVFPMPFEAQSLVFAAAAAVMALVGKRVYGSAAGVASSAILSRADAPVGREFYLDSPIERGRGRIRAADGVWRVAGPDLPAGDKVRVVAVENGVELRVDRV